MLSTNTNGDKWAQQAFQQLLAYKHNTTLYHRLVLTFQSAILLNKKNKLAHLYLARTYQLKGLYLQASECVKAAVSIPITISQSQNTQNIISMLIDLEKSFESHRSYNAAKCCLLHATAIQSKQIEYNNDLLEAMRNVQLTAEIPKQKPLNEVSSEKILEKVSKKSPLKQEIEPSAEIGELTEKENANRSYHEGLGYIARSDYVNATQCAEKLTALALNCQESDQHRYCVMAKKLFDKIPNTAVRTARYSTRDILRTLLCAPGNALQLDSVTEKTPSTSPVTVRVDSSFNSIHTTKITVGEDDELCPLSFFIKQKLTEGSEIDEGDVVIYTTPNDDDGSVGRISPIL